MSQQEIIHAYRHLYRNALHAVQFSVKGRFTVRNKLRKAFRERGATYDATCIQRTVLFLENAAKERGLEHKILKNLIHTANVREPPTPWGLALRDFGLRRRPNQEAADQVKRRAFDHYDMTVEMLNKSMGLCLR